MTRTRHRNGGLRKVCGCPRRQWPKCPHAWRMNYKPKGGPSYRLSLDAHAGKHIASKTEAAKLATAIKAAIDAGAFKTRKEAAAEAATSTQPLTTPDAVTLKGFGQTFLERAGKGSTANNRACLRRLGGFALSNGATLGDKPPGTITEDDVEAFFAHLRREGRAASTVNKYVQLTRMLFPLGGAEEVSRAEPHRRQRGDHAREDGAAAPPPRAGRR